MTTPVHSQLPSDVCATFDGEDLASKIGAAYLLLTTDADMAPRPCMLSVGEILVTSAETFRLAVWADTSTGGNLASGRPVVLCLVEPGTVRYIRGTPRKLPPASNEFDRYEVAVESVSADAHEGLPVTSGITYACAGVSSDELLTVWRRQIRDLRADL